MNDPERLLDRPPSALCAALLRAGTDETPSSRGVQRTLAALGIATTALGAAGTAGAAGAAVAVKHGTALTLASLAKWGGLGVAGGMLVAATAYRAEHTSPSPPAPVVASAAKAAPARKPGGGDGAQPPASASAPVSEEPEEEALPETLRGRGARSGSLPRPEEGEAPLAREVAYVDRGRAAFQRGESGRALELLSDYERTFPARRLMPEVLYLRMEASERSGDTVRAEELARRLLRDFPRSPHGARARALLEVR